MPESLPQKPPKSQKYIDLVAVSADGTRICSFSADEMFTILDSKVDEEKRLRLLKE